MKFRVLPYLLVIGSVFAGEDVLLPDEAFESTGGAKEVLISEPSFNPWRFRTGFAWRRLGGTSIDSDFQNSAYASRFFGPPLGTGDQNANADRTYDDGFVNVGAGTLATGLTTNWSYQNGSQVDLANDTLTYTATGGRSLSFPTTGVDGDETEIAPYIELAYFLPPKDRVEIGFSANFSFLNLDSSINTPLVASSVTTTDTYTLNGVIPPLAPYTGSFNGPGPLINNRPTTRVFTSTPIGTRNFNFENDTDLFSLSFGSEANWQVNQQLFMGLGAGIVLNFANWDASTTVPMVTPGTTTIQNVNFSNSDDELLWGLYLKAQANYRLNEQWDVEGFFRYDWNEDLEGSVGATSFEVDLSGWSLGLGLGYRF